MIKETLLCFLCFSTFFLSACAQDNAHVKNEKLVPFSNAQGKWGYMDTDRKQVVIDPKFDEAGPFQNGFAIVVQKKKYGVIASTGKTIVPMSYSFASLYTHEGFTLIITKQEYNAWWHFSSWKLLPDYNILSTRHSGPFLVTKVPMASWQIRSLPSNEILYRSKRKDDEGVWGNRYWTKQWAPIRTTPKDIEISSSDNILLIGHHAFSRQRDGKMKKIGGAIFGLLEEGRMLAKRKNGYCIINPDGKSISEKTYTQEEGLAFLTQSGKKIWIKRIDDVMPSYPVIETPVFKDSTGRYYLFPNLDQPVPAILRDFVSGKEVETAEDILSHTMLIASVDQLKTIMIYTFLEKKTSGHRLFLLKYDGTWLTPPIAGDGLDKILTDGRMIFSRSEQKGVLDTDGIFYEVPMVYITPCLINRDWYTGKDAKTGKYGIYDARKKTWQVSPAYDYLKDGPVPQVAIYSIIKTDKGQATKEWFGLLDIRTAKRITPPLYEQIDDDGRSQRVQQDARISVYLDPYTGKEYGK